MDEKIIIVNEKDEVINCKYRSKINQEDIYRVSSLWIENSKGEFLLAKRSFDKKHHPGLWGPAAAGTNAENETYESNILKEAEEEIGLKGYNFEKREKIRVSGTRNHFSQRFKLILDKPLDYFKLQEEEVAEIKWFSKEELLNEIKLHPETFLQSIKDFSKTLKD